MNKLVKGIGKLGISMIVALISGIGILWATESMNNTQIIGEYNGKEERKQGNC